jgi:hypothetical protein
LPQLAARLGLKVPRPTLALDPGLDDPDTPLKRRARPRYQWSRKAALPYPIADCFGRAPKSTRDLAQTDKRNAVYRIFGRVVAAIRRKVWHLCFLLEEPARRPVPSRVFE